jgi:hypothetical protein
MKERFIVGVFSAVLGAILALSIQGFMPRLEASPAPPPQGRRVAAPITAIIVTQEARIGPGLPVDGFVGGDVYYRWEDPERGVICYKSVVGPEVFSCVRR